MEGQADKIKPAVPPKEGRPSDALSLVKKAKPTLQGRKLGVLVTDGFDAGLLAAVRDAAKSEQAALALIAPKVGGAKASNGKKTPADLSLAGAPSVFFDAVIILADEKGAADLATRADAVNWVRDAFRHLKLIGFSSGANALLTKAEIQAEQSPGVVEIKGKTAINRFIQEAKKGRIWEREENLR